ncbi:MAG: OmpA family protein [Flavisolibacter sp.]|jgi:OOP family OmpA-OmpF porin
MKNVFASFLFIFLLSESVLAQDGYVRKKSIGVSFILDDFTSAQKIRSTSLDKVLREKQFAKFNQMSPGLGLSFINNLNRNIDFNGTFAFSFVNYPFPKKPPYSTDALLIEADASGDFKLFPDTYWVSPYVSAGLGASAYKNHFGAFIPVGAGFKINFYDEASLNLSAQYRVPVTAENANYHFVYSFGVSGVISKKKPEVLAIVVPSDRDGDGIIDVSDQCPDVPGLAKYNGCPIPDTDKDGINDEDDKCPTVPGFAKYSGCPVPDTDNDGINDEEDKCPSVPGVARYQGCPVPDTDGDGVNDEEDKCPTVAGLKENNGCPEIKQEVITRVNYAAKNIFFATASARLLKVSNQSLNEVAEIMKEDPNLKLDIEGHTDNVGKANYNLTLSQNRANSVRAYFISKGIDASRLQATGYGMTKPVADNKTSAGRAKNRRVEMKLKYY